MSNQVTEKEMLEKLSNMREFIMKLCKEYNEDANKININSRIALLDSSVSEWNERGGDKKKNQTWEEKAADWDYDKLMDVERCGASAWFPSAICINY